MNGIGGIGGWELLLVAVIAMLVLGPEHMVKHAYRLGRWARKLTLYWQEGTDAFREQLKDIEEDAIGDSIDFPNLAELKDLAAEIRMEDELAELKDLAAEIRVEDELAGGVPAQGAPDATTRSEPETAMPAKAAAEASTLDDPNIDVQPPTSYSAWRPPKK